MAPVTTGFPSLQPAFILKVKVGEANHVGELACGPQFIHFQTSTGALKSLPGVTPEIDAGVVFGGDWLYFDPDKTHARINYRGIAKTKAGIPFSFYYNGVSIIDEPLAKIFARSPEAKTTPFGSVSTIHTFEAGSPYLKELENRNCVGNGRFVLDGDSITVESRVSMVVPSTDMD